jgi:hypothetical protein
MHQPIFQLLVKDMDLNTLGSIRLGRPGPARSPRDLDWCSDATSARSSGASADMQRNVQLLKERPWSDIAVVYNDGHRAIIAIEKGAACERTFSNAFAAREQ